MHFEFVEGVLFGWRAQCMLKGIAVVESSLNKSGGNGGGSTVVDSVADAPKITIW